MKLILFPLLFFPLLASGQEVYPTSGFLHGFVEVQGGYFQALGRGRDNLEDAAIFNISAGFSLVNEFEPGKDYEPLRIGPKAGIIFGRVKPVPVADIAYALSLNTRYSFGDKGDRFRLFAELGPGVFEYGGAAFMLDLGGGVRFQHGSGTFALHGQYKEIFNAKYLDRGYEILGSLGYVF